MPCMVAFVPVSLWMRMRGVSIAQNFAAPPREHRVIAQAADGLQYSERLR